MLPWRLPPPSRRWLQLRLRTVFLLATGLCIYLAWPHLARQYAVWRLRGFGELRRDDLGHFKATTADGSVRLLDDAKVGRLVGRLVSARDSYSKTDKNAGGILFTGRIDCGRARLLVVQSAGWFTMPGENLIRVILFDRLGRVIADHDVWTPSRMTFRDLRYNATSRTFAYIEVVCHSFPPITFFGETGFQVYGSHAHRQFFAIRDEGLMLVKIDDEFGGSWSDIRGKRQHHHLAPERRFTNSADWSKALLSDDETKILEALLYLPSKDVLQQCKAADIKRLTQLSQSSDTWIREGAAAALADLDKQRD